MYKVIKRFYDLKSNHAYSVGDVFPWSDIAIDAERIAELTSDANLLGFPLIEEVGEKTKRSRKKKTEE